jgi:tetratricopeptide (TPR) repeat protein
MKPLPFLLLCAGVAVCTSIALPVLGVVPASSSASAPALAPEGGDLAELRAEVAELRAELAELRGSVTAAPAPDARVPIEAIEAAVQRAANDYLASLEAPMPAGEPAVAGESASPSPEDLLEELLDPNLSETDREALWERVREAGLVDEALALFEARAEERRDDPGAQVDAARAYLQKVFEVGDGPAAGLWAGKADAAYDRALKLDPRHWDARFGKAVSLSFWPPIFGKRGEAIGHFETLVEQQRGLAPEPRHASTYLLLGNLHAQSGDAEEAAAVWAEGYALFPDDEALAEKVQGQ